jgi:hypothetical protein
LCVVTNNTEWKKNRNMHAIIIFDMLLNGVFEPPYNKLFNTADELPLLNKTIVKSKLTEKIKNYSITDHVESMKNVQPIKRVSKLKENKKLLKESNIS